MRAGEGDAVDAGVHERAPTSGAAVTRLKTPSGSPAPCSDLPEQHARPRRLLGRLEHDGVAGDQRRAGMPIDSATGKLNGAITPNTP